MSSTINRRRVASRLALALCAAFVLAGCGGDDPGALGPTGLEGGLSPEGKRQAYVEGVSRALSQLGQATQGAQFTRAVDAGNARQLQAAAIAWDQGLEQLKQLDPPKEAAQGHMALVTSVEALSDWNRRIIAAAPNTARTKQVARRASGSPASMQFEQSVCQLVDAGFEVIDPAACSPLANADGPLQ